MKRTFTALRLLLLSLLFSCVTMATSTAVHAADPVADCSNGKFIGAEDLATGVRSFKGIPYAAPPVGELRWKAPVAAPDNSGVYEAKDFGPLPLQPTLGHLDKSAMSEDCLKLNVWTSDRELSGKPVMVYFHGGAYMSEGTAFPCYNMEYIVKAHPDVVCVSVEYRVGLMGFIDLTKVPGGEAYPDSRYLGLLDCLEGLRWVQKNIAAFGGDPNNVTIFGESAGGGTVSSLISMPMAKGLFHRVIAQSGSVNLTFAPQMFDAVGATEAFMQITDAKDMKDLCALDKDTYLKALATETGVPGLTGAAVLAGRMNMPLRGGNGPIPADMLGAEAMSAAKDVDFMVGTVADEWRYWVKLYGMPTLAENMAVYAATMDQRTNSIREQAGPLTANVDKALKSIRVDEDEWSKIYPNIWRYTAFNNEMNFRIPSIKHAQAHATAGGKGKTYMYIIGRRSGDEPWEGAFHSIDLRYVFNTPEELRRDGDAELAAKVLNMWTNFARTGDPSIDGFKWKKYDTKDRATMMVDDDGTVRMENDPGKEMRVLLSDFDPYAT